MFKATAKMLFNKLCLRRLNCLNLCCCVQKGAVAHCMKFEVDLIVFGNEVQNPYTEKGMRHAIFVSNRSLS